MKPLRSGSRQPRQVHRQTRLFTQQACQLGCKFSIRARVAPRTAMCAKMKAAGPCRDPDLAVGDVAVHDELAAIRAFDFQDAVIQAPIGIAVGVRQSGVERGADGPKHCVGGGDECGVGSHKFRVIGFTPMLRQFRIATVAIALFAVAGCGIKGPLVLPPPAAPPAVAPVPAGTSGANGDNPANPKPAAPERKP